MLDQADKLRQLVRETIREQKSPETGVPFVTVSGAQECLGASTVALTLAQELAQLGKRIILVEANLRASRAKACLSSPPRGNLSDVLNGRLSVPEVLEPISEGVFLLSGVNSPREATEVNSKAVRELLTGLRSQTKYADLVVIDAGAGMNPWIERLWAAAMQVLLISTSDPAAVMEGYAAVKLVPWETMDGKLRLVVNKCSEAAKGMRVSDSFTSTCRRFLGMRLLGEAAVLPFEKQLSSNAGTLSIRSAYRRSLRLLAADLLSQAHLAHSHKILHLEDNFGAGPPWVAGLATREFSC